MTKGKRGLPTKEDVKDALLSDKPSKEFKRYVLIVEYRKISTRLGLISAELILNNSVILRGKIAHAPETNQDFFRWDKLRIGETQFEGYLLDTKEEPLIRLIQQGFKKSIRDGRLPFISKSI